MSRARERRSVSHFGKAPGFNAAERSLSTLWAWLSSSPVAPELGERGGRAWEKSSAARCAARASTSASVAWSLV